MKITLDTDKIEKLIYKTNNGNNVELSFDNGSMEIFDYSVENTQYGTASKLDITKGVVTNALNSVRYNPIEVETKSYKPYEDVMSNLKKRYNGNNDFNKTIEKADEVVKSKQMEFYKTV